jgi:cellobiose phosphorylase
MLTNGTPVQLNEDPWFLLGNYRLTLFTHVSGQYQLISGQRSWARLNQGAEKISGLNNAVLEVLGDDGAVETRFPLVGLDSLAADPSRTQRTFGCGFARYRYELGELECRRTLSVQPSTHPRDGISAFLLDVEIRNNGSEPRQLRYTESITANYAAIAMNPERLKEVTFSDEVSVDASRGIIKTAFTAHSDDPLRLPPRGEMAVVDAFAPSLFMQSSAEVEFSSEPAGSGRRMSAAAWLEIPPGASRTLSLVIGFSFEDGYEEPARMAEALRSGAGEPRADGAFGEDWKNRLPLFPAEPDEVLRREMTWNAYCLEAMATYSGFFDETKIPQGTIYDYSWGMHASSRDNFQHALPLCYTNPELARSVLRYMMKRTTPMGDIMLLESGNGFCSNKYYQQSDKQINYFKLISEYLRITGDSAFLLEEVPFFPVKDMPSGNSIDFMERCFTFLRDQVGVGGHGLVRLLNADWNDAVYYMEKEPYNRVIFSGESHMNTVMILGIFEKLIPALDRLAGEPGFAAHKEQIETLAGSMRHYFQALEKAFYDDLGDRSFAKRIYFAGRSYGDEQMFLEAQGYLLQLESFPPERKKRLYAGMVKRVYANEKIGARQQEDPQVDDAAFEWPIINGLAGFDRAEALKRLKMMSVANAARSFPAYWSAYWSGPDNLESSLIPEEGLPDQTWTYWEVPVYCAHPHAWPLYCYCKINEQAEGRR